MSGQDRPGFTRLFQLCTAGPAPAMSQEIRLKARTHKWLLVPAIAAACVVLYALVGFLLVPWIAARELPLFAERFSRAELDKLRAETEAKARAAGQAVPSVAERVRNFAGGEPQVVDAREFYQTLLRRLRDAQALPPNALAELAQQRALAIEAALQAAGADASRVARTAAEPSANADAGQVNVRLSLSAK